MAHSRIVFIAFEGIDGAGKSTVVPALSALLRSGGVNDVQILRKSADAGGGDPAAPQLRQLYELIWGGRDDEPAGDPLGTHVHLFLHAAWFAALHRARVRPLRERPGSVAVADGWYYRTVVKAVARGVAEDWALSLFEHTAKPDLVVLLDVDPVVAWERRAGRFRHSELGTWEGLEGDPRDTFLAYQSRIRAGLDGLARRFGWEVVRQGGADTVDGVLDEVGARVMAWLAARPERRSVAGDGRRLRPPRPADIYGI